MRLTGGRARNRALLGAAALAAVALAGAVAWYVMLRPAAVATTAAPEAARTQPVTIAVLPFADMSTGKDQEAFADGITEEILNSLARIDDLQVTGRTSSFYFKGKNESLRTIGQTLGVDHLLEGSVRRDGEQLRITTQLVKASDGFHLWSQTYDRPLKDIFKVQEDIARAVADALQVTLGVGELGEIPGMTRDYQAYEAWMESRSGGQGTPAVAARGIEKLELAVKHDPAFAIAWVDLATFYGLAASLTNDAQRARDLGRQSEHATAEAKRLAPESPYVRMSEVSTLVSAGEWSRAARLARTMEEEGLRLPSFSGGLPVAAQYRLAIAVDKAGSVVNALEQARARDPLNSGISVFLTLAYASLGRVSDAVAEEERYLASFEDTLLLAGALMMARVTNDEKRVEQNWERLVRATPDRADIAYRLYELRHRPAEARAVLRRFHAEHPDNPASRTALWAAFFDDDELALEALRNDEGPGRRFISSITLWRPIMADMRRLPGFKDLAREWGFVDYWREFGWGEHCKPVGETDFECR